MNLLALARKAGKLKEGFQIQESSAKLAWLLPYVCIARPGIMMLKNAEMLAVYRVEPHDLTFAGLEFQVSTLNGLRNYLRLFHSGGVTLYTDVLRLEVGLPPLELARGTPALVRAWEGERRKIGPVFGNESFVIVVRETVETKRKLTQLYFAARGEEEVRNRLEYDVEAFAEELRTGLNMLRSVYKRVELLDTEGLLTYLHAAMAPWNPQAVQAPETLYYLDHYLAAEGTLTIDSVVRCGDWYILVAAIHDFPGKTRARMTSRMLSLPLACRLTTRFEFASKEAARRQVADLRRFVFQKRKGFGAMATEVLSKQTSSLENTEAIAQAAEASAAMAQFAGGEVTYGKTTTTFMTWGRSYEDALWRLEEFMRQVSDEGYLVKRETINAAAAYLGSIPGNLKYNHRNHIESSENLEHLFLLSSPWTGMNV